MESVTILMHPRTGLSDICFPPEPKGPEYEKKNIRKKSKKRGKDLELIQSNTSPYPGPHMGK